MRRGRRDAPVVRPDLRRRLRDDRGDVALLLASLHDPAHVTVPPLAQDDLAGDGVVDVGRRVDGGDALADGEQERLHLAEIGLARGVGVHAERHQRERHHLFRPVQQIGTALAHVLGQRVIEVEHRLRLLVHDLVVVEEHRDAEVLDDVVIAGRVIRRLQERRIQVLEIRQQRLVQGHQALLLDQLGHRVLAGHDNVVRRAARVQLGQQLVVAGVEGLVHGHPGLLLRRELRELRERGGVVVLRPVVYLEVALQRLPGQGVGRT